MSNPVGFSARLCAAASLSLLLTRLRVTAFPTAFDTMNPTRVGAAGFGTAYKTTFRRPLRAPERTVWEKSADDRTRFLAASIQDAKVEGLSCWRSIGKPKAVYADSSVRPLERRAERMARPARVRMRRRKPCFLARRRLFG